MSDILDENKELNNAAETDDGMFILFPDEEDVSDDASDADDNDGESFSLSFGKVNAAKKEEEFSFMPFLNIPEVIDEDDEEEEEDGGESFSLSFGKVSAAKKERDYVYLPFLNVDENAVEEPEEDDESDEDSGIDIVGGDDLFDLTPLKTKDSAPQPKKSKAKESNKSNNSFGDIKKPSAKKGKNAGQQKKKTQQKNSIPQKPNKVQQIIAQMDPDIIASVSADPRQMIMLEETIRSELIKQAAHNAVAKELGTDLYDTAEVTRKRPPQQNRQRTANSKDSGSSLNFAKQKTGNKKSKPISIVDTSTISEFGAEPAAPQPAVQQIPNTPPAVQPQGQPIKTVPPVAPVITQPVIVQQPIPSAQVVQPQSAAAQTQSTAQRKPYVPTSPAAIRAAMKSGALSFDSPSSGTSDSSPEPASAQSRKRMEIQKQIGEKRSGCVIGVIALLMVVFVVIIALIGGGDVLTQCGYSEEYSKAEALIEQGKYTDAMEILESIKSYSQTAPLLNECYYQLGLKEQNEGYNTKAIEYYNKTVDYAAAIRSRIDLQKAEADGYSEDAAEKSDAEKYLKAYNLYSTILSDFEEHPEVANDGEIEVISDKVYLTKFEYAKSLYSEKKYSDAKLHFQSLMDDSYDDAKEWYYNSCCNLGIEYFENGNYFSAADELEVFEQENHGINSTSYSKAISYLALSRLYKIDDIKNETSGSLTQLYSLFVKANESGISGEVLEDIKSAMSSHNFDIVKMNGIWQNDEGAKITFEKGKFSAYMANGITGNVSEISSGKVEFADGDAIITVNGTKQVVMSNIAFDSTYQLAPQTLSFVNPFDGLTYKMYRNK